MSTSMRWVRAALILLGLLWCFQALGHGSQFTADEVAWMDRQRAVDGTKCCNEHDIFMLSDPQWRVSSGHYEVRAFGAWHQVPPGRMMRYVADDPSPFPGEVFVFYSRVGSGIMIWCFSGMTGG